MKHVYQIVARAEGIPELVEADNYLTEDSQFKFVDAKGKVLAEYPAADIASVSCSPKV